MDVCTFCKEMAELIASISFQLANVLCDIYSLIRSVMGFWPEI